MQTQALATGGVHVRLGFVSLETMLTGQPGMLVTRPLIFDSSQTSLFVNAVVQPGGFIQIGVKGSSTLTLKASSVRWSRASSFDLKAHHLKLWLLVAL